MKTVDLIQGTLEWHQHRATHFNASDAPAMLGVSKYKTRSQLLKEMATGIIDEVDAATQRRFDDGHRFEALARPLAEKIIGDDLSPVVGVCGKFSASFDGITFDESVIFEHKTLNDKLRGIIGVCDLPEEYCAQMEQQLLVSGAEKCLFMASKFDENDELIEEMHVWYYPDIELRKKIIAGWSQFEIDVANYHHIDDEQVIVAAPTKDLPTLSIQVNGSISLISNLTKFGVELCSFVEQINKEPADDQGFADAEAAIKTLQNAQDALEAAEANALAQTADIDDMRKTVKHYADIARTTRLMLEKMVKARKDSIRIEIVTKANAAYAAHIAALEAELSPIRLVAQKIDAAGAIKGKRTIASLNDAVDTVLRNGKIEADALAADIRSKLAWYKESSAGFYFLFNDLQSIIYKPDEDFRLMITSRIDQHKAAEAAKLEAERAAIQEAADRKAKAEADAIIAAERAVMQEDVDRKAKVEAAKLEAERAVMREAADRMAKAEAAMMEVERAAKANVIEEQRKAAQIAESVASQRKTLIQQKPSDGKIIEVVMSGLNCSKESACEWIITCAENLTGEMKNEKH